MITPENYSILKSITRELQDKIFEFTFSKNMSEENEVIRNLKLQKYVREFCQFYYDKIFKCTHDGFQWIYRVDLSEYEIPVMIQSLMK